MLFARFSGCLKMGKSLPRLSYGQGFREISLIPAALSAVPEGGR